MIYRGLIFDLDGTLADTLIDIACSMNRILVKNGYPVHTVGDYKMLVGRGLENLVLQSLPSDKREPGIVSKCLKEMVADYENNCLVNTVLYKGISELISELVKKHVKLAVFSNKAEPLTRMITGSLLSGVSFVSVTGARPDLPRKPDPAGALQIASVMGLSVQDVIYMGDSDVDMMTATRAGMYAVGVLWGFRTREELQRNGAKMLVDHPLDLLKLWQGCE
jgi:phosphoglycolate phosphatase